MLQLILPLILAPITHIVNISFETGLVPGQWGTCSTFPVLKKPDSKSNSLTVTDLRPITILPVCLKIAERVLHDQLQNYVEVNQILPPLQSGFRKGYSTTSALCSITDDFIRARDSGQLTSLTLLDLSKAFDSVHLACLLAKLQHYGIRDNIHNWLSSYLYSRSQFTIITAADGLAASDVGEIVSGVPQNSILGPLLFSIYMADITCHIDNCTIHLYADGPN